MKTFTIGISLMALGLAPALGLPSPLNGQDPDSGSFRILVGGELLAVESFRRGPSGIEGELSGEAVGRIEYRMSATASGASSTTMSFWSFDAPAESAPSQEVRLDIEGGQITARVTNANGTSEGHFAAPEGTLPYLNPSFALLQELVRESSAGGEGSTTTHSVFMVQGGKRRRSRCTTSRRTRS